MMRSFRDSDFDFNPVYAVEDDRLKGFFIPTLERSVRYDRVSGYFTSSALVSVARGLVGFIRNGGRMRLLAGAQLSEQDAVALNRGKPLEEVLVEQLLHSPLNPEGLVAERRLEVLAWMVREGRLEVRIAVRLDAQGRPVPPAVADSYYHSKMGVFHDAVGNRLAMVGSNNESAPGWSERGNAETFHVYPSWLEDVWRLYGRSTEVGFERQWNGELTQWRIFPLPEAVRQRLIKFAPLSGDLPFESDQDLERQPATTARRVAVKLEFVWNPELEAAAQRLRDLLEAPKRDGGTGVGIVTAPVEPWPHQRRIAHRATSTFPRSYLFADEVGMGKTIEAGLVFRELLLSGKAERILILVPASVIKQWQEELLEKFLLRIPRYDGGAYYYRAGGEDEPVVPSNPGNPWSAYPVLIATSHLARTKARRQQVLDAGSWDVVFVDEAHHARRRGSKADASANALLNLLQAMKANRAWKALYLASATPMQMHAHEAWDLLELLGLTAQWSASAETFTRYYEQLRAEGHRDWAFLQGMLADHLSDPANKVPASIENHIRGRATSALKAKRVLEFHTKPSVKTMTSNLDTSERELLDLWLRENTPMRRRVFRTTRTTLHEYKRTGLLGADTVIPERHVEDRFIAMNPAEADLYLRIEEYISRYYNRYKNAGGAQRALGFIMTVYRRRLTSSFQAITRSLQKRHHTLTRDDTTLAMLLDEDDAIAFDTSNIDPGELETVKLQLTDELHELDAFLGDLERLPPDESKMLHLLDDLQAAFHHGHRTAIVFTQYGDTLHYLADKLTGTFGEAVATWSGAGGTRWNAASRTWVKIPKPILKDLFRAGEEIRILIGTDSMSEGLNLQTCGYLVNYDMPWNFMRVEQRIGRIDRIGGQPHVHIRNYFYRDTVEQRIYEGLKEDIDWFENVVGPARPVLGQLEAIIEDVAMHADAATRDAALTQAIKQVRADLEAARKQPVQLDETTLTQDESDEPRPHTTLATIEAELTTNPLTQPHLHPQASHTYRLQLGTTDHLVTFNRTTADIAQNHPQLLTYGHPLLHELIDHVTTPRSTHPQPSDPRSNQP